MSRWPLGLLCSLLCTQVLAGRQEVVAAATCLRAQLPATTVSLSVTLLSEGAQSGRLNYQGELFWRPPTAGQHALQFRLQQPVDLAGTTWLWRDDLDEPTLDMYLPGLHRVKRLRGEAVNAELWGSGLRYSDLRYLLGIGLVSDFDYLRQGEYGGRATTVLGANIPPASGWGDARLEMQIDQALCVVLELSFFAQNGSRHKSLRADLQRLETTRALWPRRYLLTDHRLGGTTDLRLGPLQHPENVSAELFDSESFYRLIPGEHED